MRNRVEKETHSEIETHSERQSGERVEIKTVCISGLHFFGRLYASDTFPSEHKDLKATGEKATGETATGEKATGA